jgi:putative PIN family toxin of toxin-antitoxin system
MGLVVIDTNIVLDLFLFLDASQGSLRQALGDRRLTWIATPAMQQELAFVLARESTQQQARKRGTSTHDVMQAMEDQVSWVSCAPVCAFRCKDRTDQGFVDLAFFHQSLLISKDKAILKLAKRLSAVGVEVTSSLE